MRLDLLVAKWHLPPEGDDLQRDGSRLGDNPQPLPILLGEGQPLQESDQPHVVPPLNQRFHLLQLCPGEPLGEKALELLHPVRGVQQLFALHRRLLVPIL